MAGAGIEIKLTIDRAKQARLERNLQLLPEKVLSKVVGQAASYAMTPVLKDARRNCPVRHGLLRKSLGKKRKTYRRSGTVVVLVGPRTGFKDPETGANPVNYAHLVEGGTSPHMIAAPPGGLKIGEGVVRGKVQHPGARAQPFMRPALEHNRTTVVRRYRGRLLQGVEREVRKLGVGS